MTEAQLHQAVVNYLRAHHPEVMFRTDFAAGVKMTMGQAKKHKGLQSGRAWPDLFIAESRDDFFGLFIELKRDGTKLYTKNGSIVANKHIREQFKVCDDLLERGYAAMICVGYDQTIKEIDSYMMGES